VAIRIHDSIFETLKKYKTYRNARKFLKSLGVSKGDQNFILQEAKKKGMVFS